MLTVGFTELRNNLSAVTNEVMTSGEEVTVFKRNRPAFKIVPLETRDRSEAVSDFSAAADRFIDQYESVFERLAQ